MIELVVAGTTIAIAAWAVGVHAHQRSIASRSLARYATSRRLRFVPSTRGAEARRTSPRVHGSKDDVDYVFDLYRIGDQARTRVSCVAPGGRAPVLCVSQRGALPWAPSRGAPVRRVDHPAFDAAYVVRRSRSEVASDDADVLNDVADALRSLAHRDDVWLRSDGTAVSLSWRGVESHPAVLDAASDALVRVARFHRPETPYR